MNAMIFILLEYLTLVVSVDNYVVMKIQKNGSLYCDAIDMSIKTAEDGYAFSSDIINLCDFLLDPSTELDDILDYVKTIRDKANRARIEAAETMEKFRTIYTNAMEVRSQRFM